MVAGAGAWSKQSLTLNLKHEAGKQILRQLVSEADIVIENFRPGVMEKLGLGWEQLSAINPWLVMLRLSGFGQSGPHKDQPGFGAVGESMGGACVMSPASRIGRRCAPASPSAIRLPPWGVIGAQMA